MVEPTIQTLAEDSLLVTELALDQAQALADHLRPDAQWSEVVQGLDSVAVAFDAHKMDRQTARQLLAASLAGLKAPRPEEDQPFVELPISYGGEFGPDLERLSAQLGLAADEVISLHQTADYSVDLIGFMPGFAYLSGLNPRLKADRLPTPRLRLPAGSVGVSGLFSGLYPLDSPGGWPIIGRVRVPLWDPVAADPFVLRAGMNVRFVPS